MRQRVVCPRGRGTGSLPGEPTDSYDSVVKLVIEGTPEVESLLPSPGKDGVLELTADKTFIHNNEGSRDAGIREHEGIPHVGYWLDDQAWIEWEIEIAEPGNFQVSTELSVQEAGTSFRVITPTTQLTANVPTTGSYGRYTRQELGPLQIETPGRINLQIKPVVGSWQPMNLRSITLKRID